MTLIVVPAELVSRRAEALVAEALTDTRVVLVNGARQAGKSTLTRLAAARMPGRSSVCWMIRRRCGLRRTIRPGSWSMTR